MNQHTIILMGLRASGKSTIGKLLAEQTNRSLIDLDDRTAELLGVQTAGEAIDRFGIDRFREAETQALAQALEEKIGIVSLGGGSPTAPGSAALLEAAGRAGDRIVYLHAPPRELSARLLADQINNRPSLTGLAPVQEVQALYEQRDPLYRALATRVIQIAGRPPEQVAAVIRVFEAS